MKLWTIQPEAVFEEIKSKGFYHCDIQKSYMYDWLGEYDGYDWLVSQMKRRIGPPPVGVSYPVWAWQNWQGKRKMPDIRAKRWHCGSKGEKFFRLEIEIPDNEVLLSDFDAWGIILNNGLLSDTEEEDKKLEEIYKSLTPQCQKEMRSKNWERVFDITPFENDWIIRGYSVQATFWELRAEQIRKIKIFVSSSKY